MTRLVNFLGLTVYLTFGLSIFIGVGIGYFFPKLDIEYLVIVACLLPISVFASWWETYRNK